ncbi:MAG: hypothetical protein HC927_03535, partial [Deltaproteobacteria bacterium]|nr:hypothetical protein [Deltaproteobacteria bacterium]
MASLWQRIFGSRPPARDYWRGPKLAGIDAISERAIALQKAYWTVAPDELARLEAIPVAELEWAEALRMHHLLCLALIDAADGLLRKDLLAPIDERSSDALPAELEPLRARVQASARRLL